MKIIGVNAILALMFRKRGFGRFILRLLYRPAPVERGPAFLPGRVSDWDCQIAIDRQITWVPLR